MPETTSYRHGTPCWVDLATTDLAGAQDFYAQVLGWTYVDTGEEGGHYQMAMLRDRPVAGMMAMMPEMSAAGVPSSWTAYLAADDADEVAKRIADHGGVVLNGPMDVMTQGRMLVARDPAGAVFGVWQGIDMKGAGFTAEPGAFAWHELLSRDPAAAGDFYAGVFGFRLEAMEVGLPGPYTILMVGDEQVAGMMAMPDQVPADVPSYWNVYFAVADADAAVDTARRLGATVLMEPMDSPYGRLATLADPQGAVLSVMRLPR
jgi:predicted enzyme related to lactoylglutathione lyase